MRILVLGVTGTLGHKVYQTFREESDYEVIGTMRGLVSDFVEYPIFDHAQSLEVVKANMEFPRDAAWCLSLVRPDIVINCVGFIKPNAVYPYDTILINSLFPHALARACETFSVKLIHISTDCVFSGRCGGYTELAEPDPNDLYGRTKLLGEVIDDPSLTIRTSFIGREMCTKLSLVEWILKQRGEVDGYVNAIFSGLSTRALSRVLLELVEKPTVSGLLHVHGEKIDKWRLLCMVNDVFGLGLTVNRFENVSCDRSLKSSRFSQLNIKVPPMRQMIEEMYSENSMYEVS